MRLGLKSPLQNKIYVQPFGHENRAACRRLYYELRITNYLSPPVLKLVSNAIGVKSPLQNKIYELRITNYELRIILKFGQAVLPIFPSPVAPVAYHTPAAASKGFLGMS